MGKQGRMGEFHTPFPPLSMRTVHGINRFVGFKQLHKRSAFEAFLDEHAEARKRWNVLRPVLDGILDEKQAANTFHLSTRTIRRWKKRFDPTNWYSLLPESRAPKARPRVKTPLERYERVVNIANENLAWGAPKISDYIVLHDPPGMRLGKRTVSRLLVRGLENGDIAHRVKLKTKTKTRRDVRGRTIRRVKDSTKDVVKPGERVQTDGVIVQIWDAGEELLRKLYFSCSIDRFSRAGMVTVGESLNASLTIENHSRIQKLIAEPIEEVINDNGGENLGDCLEYYEGENIIQLFTYPHAPKQNAICERFNRTFQEECLLGRRIDLTQSIEIIQEQVNAWLVFYNTERPHEALDGFSPILALFRWRWQLLPQCDKENYPCGHMLWRGTHTCLSSLYKV
jgi:putative transposase